jgi:hypothetical protein
MSIERYWPGSSETLLAGLVISCVLAVLSFCADQPLLSENVPQNQRSSLSGHQLVVLLDVNANQKKVLPVELTLAEGVIQKLGRPENVFSVITFGSQPPALLKSGVHADEAIAAIRDVSLEQTGADYLSIHLYDALNRAFGQFTDEARPKSILIITEGNDARGKIFKQTLSRVQQLHVTCDVALVADHTFYGPKAIQRYGFYLRELAAKTHGRYVEVGGRVKKTPRSVDRFSKGILAQDRKQ